MYVNMKYADVCMYVSIDRDREEENLENDDDSSELGSGQGGPDTSDFVSLYGDNECGFYINCISFL